MKTLNPIKVIAIWISAIVVINIIALPLLYDTTVGGEQSPLTFIAKSANVAVYGIFLLSIITVILYFKWVKKFWFISVSFFLISGIYVLQDTRRAKEMGYGFDEQTELVNGSEIKTKKEYYNSSYKKLRSESYWKNGRKDSIWITYGIDGKVLQKLQYKNDSLIENIK